MATPLTKEKNRYSEAFRAQQQSRAARTRAPWVERLRENALDRFEQLGFPTTDEEDWKYTNVAPIAKADFRPIAPDDASLHSFEAHQLEGFACSEASRSRLVFVNGIYRPELSVTEGLPDGLVALNLSEALADARYEDVLREHLARDTGSAMNGFVALNTAFLGDGAFVMIPRGVRATAPLHLLFINDGREPQAASFPRVLIVGERESALTVVESYAGAGEDAVYLTSAVSEISLKENARLEFYRIQREGLKAFHVGTTSARLSRGSSFNSTAITLGGRLSRHDIDVRFEEAGAECAVDGLYVVGTGQHADTHSLIDHAQPHCTSHQLYKGILDGTSRAVFNGKVFVRHDAQQTDATQTNRNLLLSNEARVDTKPQLEIFADDVKCAHGATVGQLEDEELFYLASRGLSPEVARNLLTYGFAEEVIEKIKLESIRRQLDAAVLNRLHARLED